MKVYAAINAVSRDLSHDGIAKSRKNAMQGYNFRGIDDMYNALAIPLANHGLCILPRVISRLCEERQSQKGGALFYVTVECEFDFVAAEDGSKHTIKTYGEAMDSGDKATNKAMSAAYKYACMQTFCIPTEADNDADAQTHEVRPKGDIAPMPKVPPKLINPLIKTADYTIEESRAFELFDAAKKAVAKFEEGKNTEAFNEVSGITDNGEKLYLWAVLKEYSGLRNGVIKPGWKAAE